MCVYFSFIVAGILFVFTCISLTVCVKCTLNKRKSTRIKKYAEFHYSSSFKILFTIVFFVFSSSSYILHSTFHIFPFESHTHSVCLVCTFFYLFCFISSFIFWFLVFFARFSTNLHTQDTLWIIFIVRAFVKRLTDFFGY